MKKAISLMIFMILMLIVLTGCVNVDYTVKVNEDGSGDITYIYGIEKSMLESFQMSPEDLMSEMKNEVQNSDYMVETYETDTEIGFRASKYIKNVATDISLEEVFGKEYIKDSEQNRIQIEKTSLKTKYSQNVLIDLTSMKEMAHMGITMKYRITLPTKIDAEDTNGIISKDGKTITWNLKVGEENDISFEVEKTNFSFWFITGGTIGFLVIVGTIILIIKNKTKKDNKDKKEYDL